MSIIEASSVSIKTMADGTLRISVDVEPRHAQAAFALFGSPGTSMALAALRSVPEPAPAPQAAPKGGQLSHWVALRGEEQEFRDFLSEKFRVNVNTPAQAAECVRHVCEVQSRADLDNDPDAAERFHRLIRGPYSKRQIARGVAA